MTSTRLDGYLLQLCSSPAPETTATCGAGPLTRTEQSNVPTFWSSIQDLAIQNFKQQPDPRCVRHAPYPRLGFRTAVYKLTGGMSCSLSLTSASRLCCVSFLFPAQRRLLQDRSSQQRKVTANGHRRCAGSESHRSVRAGAHCSSRTMMTISITVIRPCEMIACNQL